MAAEADFRDLVGESDSEDENFLGFTEGDIVDGDSDSGDELSVTIDFDGDVNKPNLNAAYHSPWLRDFTEATGPRNLDTETTEFGIFSKLFDDEIVDVITDESNRYADQFIQKEGETFKKHARARQWYPVTGAEVRAFIAIILCMGIVRLPCYDLYWTTDFLLEQKMKTIMARDRFYNILAFLHVANNSLDLPRDDPHHDFSYKIRNIAEKLITNWQTFYYPKREVSVDETLVPFKGRTKILQYIPSKPHKWGLKVWTLAESKTGYVWNWDLYCGKLAMADRSKGVAHQVVTQLCTPIFGKGHHVYVDNFFSSPALFQELRNNQTGACGTLRTNRQGVPPTVKQAKLSKDAPLFVHRDNELLYISWLDKRQVNLLTTVHNGNTFVKQVRSKFHANYVRNVECPMSVQLYTNYMGGVDLADQQVSYSTLMHRTLKWWKKLFLCNLLEVTVSNAKVIFKALNPDKRIKSDKFRLAIIYGLLEGFERQNVHRKPKPCNDPPSRLTERHFLSINGKKTPAGRQSYQDCQVCSNREQKKRHETQYICQDCNIPLCIYPCFQRYHTILNYKIPCSKELHVPQSSEQ
jgi:hypothetical protein